MGKKVPRRLKRFNREGTEPTEEAMKGINENKFFYDSEQNESSASEMKNMMSSKKMLGRETSSKEILGKESSNKEIATELALEEVQRFKNKHQRFPKKEEYESISESIYAQLKNKEQRKKAIERLERKKGKRTRKKDASEGTEKDEKKKKHGRHGHEKEKTEEKGFLESKTPKDEIFEEKDGTLTDEEIKGMSVEDLFSSNKKEKGNAGFEELEKIDGREFSLKGLEEIEEKSDASNKCPKCGAEIEEVVFCPECGTAFCEKCAKKVEVQGNVKTFVCPSCSKKIKK